MAKELLLAVLGKAGSDLSLPRRSRHLYLETRAHNTAMTLLPAHGAKTQALDM
jgi:hypothetical protein